MLIVAVFFIIMMQWNQDKIPRKSDWITEGESLNFMFVRR